MLQRLFVLSTLMMATTAQAGLLPELPTGGFEVFATDSNGGGWVIHHFPGRGDTLWGCKDVSNIDNCTPVYLNDWRNGASMSFLHVSDRTQSGWLKLSVPTQPDHILACKSPEGTPECEDVRLALLPPASSVKRIWPDYACDKGCEGGGGGLMGGGSLNAAAQGVIEPAANGTMLVQGGPALPGAVNLYACRNLESSPECELTVPNWLAVDRENIGLKKLEEIETETDDGTEYGPGVIITDVVEDSVAWKAKLRPGMTIIKVGEFQVNRAGHLKAMLAQYTAGAEIKLTLDGGKTVSLRPRPKPAKKGKK